MGVVDEDVVDVVLEDGGFAVYERVRREGFCRVVSGGCMRSLLLDGRKVASCEDVKEGCLAACSVASVVCVSTILLCSRRRMCR